jgi:protein-S-isoprenylcysteine O-methyltransferase Ste14
MTFLESKIPPPLVGLFFALLMWWSAPYLPIIAISPTISYLLISILGSIGIFFDLSAAISFRLAKTTVNPLTPNKASSLVTTGVYQFTRNPMYVGRVFFLFAWAIFLSSLWVVIFIAGYMAYIQRFQILPEEQALVRIFKQDFIEYKTLVRRWL